MASEMVEGLAKAYTEWLLNVVPTPDYQANTARFFVNAIADELDESEDDALEHIGQYEPDVYSGEVAARWLRTQAGESE